MPDAVFANIGKLLLATKIYDMHRLAHYVSGGLIVALPGPDEDHNPETAASLAAVLAGRPDIPTAQRLEVARLMEDLTASHQGGWYSVISLHGGGSPEAMKREIWRNYPVAEKVELVERLLDRGVLDDGRRVSKQPGRCCPTGCEVPEVQVGVPRAAEPAAEERTASRPLPPLRGAALRGAPLFVAGEGKSWPATQLPLPRAATRKRERAGVRASRAPATVTPGRLPPRGPYRLIAWYSRFGIMSRPWAMRLV